MAESLLVELGKTIGDKVGSEVWKTIVGAADIGSQIEGLEDIKPTLQATLLDADSSEVCSRSQRDVLEKLQRGLDKLIDFQDAKAAKAKQKELMGGSKFTKEARMFFSGSNQLVTPFKDASKIKGIRGELSRIAANHAQFGSIVSSSTFNQTRTLSNDSDSYMCNGMVVGRDGDKDKMVNMLLNPPNGDAIPSVASIVGMGGIGKTTLAKYVFDDQRIVTHFDLRLWAFTTQAFDVKDMLQQIVGVGGPTDDGRQLLNRLLGAVAGKRFLLVLDGVWDADILKARFVELRGWLRVGAQGSQILLTTRSNTVAKMIGTQDPYMVGHLGNDDSWLLFESYAITQWHEPGMEAVGRKIAKMCHNVPLVIRVIGSLLAGKFTVREWSAFWNDEFSKFASYGRSVIDTLKVSYDHLSPNLKLCVAYCSLFPKGFRFKKDFLIHLWIALGYVKEEYANQSIEDVAENYVLCLLERGFFHGYNKDGHKFKMHNLMHDLVLSELGMCEMPSSVGKLIHLRYLDFSNNPIYKLPVSITKLVHLYLLDLSLCSRLEELPEDINKLASLRHLNLKGCRSLRYMPKKLSILSNLVTLGLFVVGKPSGSKADLVCNLADLSCFNNLEGSLKVVLGDRSKDIVSEAQAVNLSMKKITDFHMVFRGSLIEDEMVLENLKPCSDLTRLTIEKYGGRRLPSWMREGIHSGFPNLVSIIISGCQECVYVGSFGGLPHLKSLTLESLEKVEYIENGDNCGNNSDNTMVLANNKHASTRLFPSLLYLTLREIPKLKGWRSVTDCAQDQRPNHKSTAFPKLERIEIDMELVITLAKVFLPTISSLYYLAVYGVESWQTTCGRSSNVILLNNYFPMLLKLIFSDKQMRVLPEEFRGMSSLELLFIHYSEALEAVPEWIDSLTSLKGLYMYGCQRLKSLPHEISNLSNLTSLTLRECSLEFAERCQEPSGEDWPKIQHIPNIKITQVSVLDECDD